MDGHFLYAAQSSPHPASGGTVAAYAIEDGVPRKISEHPCASAEHPRVSTPCHISISTAPAGKFLFFADYSNGLIGVFRICENGALEGPLQTLKHAGALGPRKDRQDAPHCHCIVQSHDGWVFVCDLGLDKVAAYSFDPQSGRLIPSSGAEGFTAVAGSGPRHIIFDPECEHRAYLINELDSTLVSLNYCGDGILKARQTLSTLPVDFTGETKAAAVKISPCGEWALASNRGYDSIAAFRIGADGTLAPPVISKLGGRFPRDFEFSPDGRHIIVGHKLSNEMAAYAFDPATGALAQTTAGIATMTRPLCFIFETESAANA